MTTATHHGSPGYGVPAPGKACGVTTGDNRASTSPARRALVVDDAPEFRELVSRVLQREDFAVETAADGARAVDLARSFRPDVIILDLGLPELDGIEVCRQVRTFTDAYIVMLTGRDDEVDKLVGLSIGADDYLTKPFSPRELVARIKVMLRRPRGAAAPGAEFELGALRIDIPARVVHRDGEPIELTRTEFELLQALLESPRVTLTRAQLLDRVWGPDWFGDEHVVDVHISNLRRKIEDDPAAPAYVRTVRGVGYRLEPSPSTDGGRHP